MTHHIDTQKFKHTSIGWVPKEWEVKELGLLFNFKNGINSGKENYGKGIKFINVMEVIYNERITPEIIPGTVQISDDQLNLYRVKDGDVLFNRTSETTEEIGMASVFSGVEDVVFGGFVIRGRPIENVLTDDFKKYCFRSKVVRTQIIKGGQGAIRTNIGQGDLEKVKIAIPIVSEQRHIADLLGTWDHAIETTQKLIAQKELRKKWLMQVLLTGKKRLKGFDGEWKTMKLGDVFERVTRKNSEGNNTVVTISAQRGFIRQEDFFNKKVASDIIDNYFLVEKGEFCYNKSYSNGYPWGATKRLNDYPKAVVTTLYICFSLKNTKENSGDFFEHFFEANLLDNGLTQIAHEGGRAHGLLNVTPNDFFNLRITVPSFPEQTAIATILQMADSELQLLKRRLEKLKEQKKGLMQVLLTGRLRLKGSEPVEGLPPEESGSVRPEPVEGQLFVNESGKTETNKK